MPEPEFRQTAGIRASFDSGTGHMIVGTFVAALAAYLFQLVVGRSLGPTDFAPITVLWTIQFLAFTTVFLPIEQLTIRRLNAADVAAAPWRPFAVAIGITTVVGVGFAAVARERLLDGEWAFVGITAVLIVAYGVFAMGRGILAGRRRFREYGLTTLAESVVRLLLAVVLILAGVGVVGISWTLVAGALVIYAWAPFRSERGSPHGAAVEIGTAGALTTFVVATAAAQTLVAAGPLVVGGLGGSAADISVFFETFLLFRAPLTVAYSLVARVLPPFTRMVESGNLATLRRWTVRLGSGAAVTAVAAFAVGYEIGPQLVEIFLGAEFRPEPVVAAFAVSGVVLATVALFTQQILIAMRATTALAWVWLGGVCTAVVTIAAMGGTPNARVGAGFLAGEAIASLGLVIAVLLRSRDA
jgi:O-antigen/teichoic acid export membrane protein